MIDRYAGREDLTGDGVQQLIRYIGDNYVDGDGERLELGALLGLVNHEEAWEWVQTGIANRSFVYYVGDMIADRAQLNEIDEIDEIDEEDDSEH